MKTLIVLLTFLIAQSVFANSTELKSGDLSLSQAEAEMVSAKEICPKVPGRMSCMAYGSVVTVKIKLNGCLDRLGGYFTNFEVIDGKGILSVGSINVFNKASMTARCVARPFKTVKVQVPFEGEIEVVNSEYTGMN